MSPTKQKINLEFTGGHSIAELLGDRDELIKMIERKYNIEVFILGDDLEISGKAKNVREVTKLIKELALQVNLGQSINKEKVSDSIKILENSPDIEPHKIFKDSILVNSGKKIKPRTEGQKIYIDSIKKNTIVFGIGPAGTGKTYLALATAVEALKEDRIGRIILVKPVVEVSKIRLRMESQDLARILASVCNPLWVSEICHPHRLAATATSPSLKKGMKTAISRTKGMITSDRLRKWLTGSRDKAIRTAITAKYKPYASQLLNGVNTTATIKAKVTTSLPRGSSRWITLSRSLYRSRKLCFIV